MSLKAKINDLDKDFLYYLKFTQSYAMRIKSQNDILLCKVWLQYLTEHVVTGVEGRLNRNLYLSYLIHCIYKGELHPIYKAPPGDPLPPFPIAIPDVVETPVWVDELLECGDEILDKDGRTYMATKHLDDNRGAFAYVGVTLNDGDPEWLPQAGREQFEKAIREAYRYHFGDVSIPDPAAVLASRKTSDERNKALKFYQSILDNINGQLTGRIKEGSSDVVNNLLIRLIQGMRRQNRYRVMLQFPRRERLFILLQTLANRLNERINRLVRREILLDEIEKNMLSQSLLSETFPLEDRYTGVDWREHGIDYRMPEDSLKCLNYIYPPEVIDTFVILMEKEKQSMGDRARRSHEGKIAIIKRELRLEKNKSIKEITKLQQELSEIKAAVDWNDKDKRKEMISLQDSMKTLIGDQAKQLASIKQQHTELLKVADHLAMMAGITRK